MIPDLTRRFHEAAEKMMRGEVRPTMPFDPFAIAQATTDFTMGLTMRPQDLMQVQVAAVQQWSSFWAGTLGGKASEPPRDRRFSAPEWQDDAYYRSLRDAYRLAWEKLRDWVAIGDGSDSGRAMVRSASSSMKPCRQAISSGQLILRPCRSSTMRT